MRSDDPRQARFATTATSTPTGLLGRSVRPFRAAALLVGAAFALAACGGDKKLAESVGAEAAFQGGSHLEPNGDSHCDDDGADRSTCVIHFDVVAATLLPPYNGSAHFAVVKHPGGCWDATRTEASTAASLIPAHIKGCVGSGKVTATNARVATSITNAFNAAAEAVAPDYRIVDPACGSDGSDIADRTTTCYLDTRSGQRFRYSVYFVDGNCWKAKTSSDLANNKYTDDYAEQLALKARVRELSGCAQ